MHNHILLFFLQKLKTRVIKKDVNPEWNEDITFSVTDPNHPILLVSELVNTMSFVVCKDPIQLKDPIIDFCYYYYYYFFSLWGVVLASMLGRKN